MTNKNNLAALKIQPKNTLANLAAPKASWRKCKSIDEKQSELVGLRFTPSELLKIKKKAGLIPIATYLKNELINANLMD